MSEYKKDLEIDIEELEIEWVRHSVVSNKYSDLKADAKLVLDRTEEKKKTIRSQLILQAQKGNAEDLEDVKLTDKNVEAWYRTQPEYIKAVEERNQAEYEYNILTGVVFNFNDRKTALENLVKLCLGSYYSGPVEPRDLSDIKKRVNEKAGATQRKKLNKKEKK